MELSLDGLVATMISAYAPVMTAPEEEKEAFYEQLNTAVSAVPYHQKLILLCDFNARVGRNHTAWPKVLGYHGLGNENANGSLLLQLCALNHLCITNTLFQQRNKLKIT